MWMKHCQCLVADIIRTHGIGLAPPARGDRSTDIVMEIAAGTGYITAVLAKMASTVVAIESDEVLADRATSNLVGRNTTPQ